MEQLNRFIYPEELRKAKATTNVDVVFILEQNSKTYEIVHKKQQQLIEKGQLPIIEPVKQKVLDIDASLQNIYNFVPKKEKPLIAAVILAHTKQYQELQEQTQHIKQLHNDNEQLKIRIQKQTQLIDQLKEYQERKEEEEQALKERREKRKRRYRKPKTSPIYRKEFDSIIKFLEHESVILDTQPLSKHLVVRIRLFVTILFLTGLRFSEVLSLNFSQLCMFYFKHYIIINKKKRGEQGIKVFIPKALIEIIKARKNDFFYLKTQYNVNPTRDQTHTQFEELYKHLFVFSGQKELGTKHYARSYFTQLLNKVLIKIPDFQVDGKKYTTHSFRHGRISAIYDQTKDIVFTSRAIGHASTNVTTTYVAEDSINEIQRKVENFKY